MELKLTALAAAALCATLASAGALAQAQNPSPTDPAMSGSANGDSKANTPMSHGDAPSSPSDVRATQDVNARLSADPKHFFRHVQVSVHDGVAQLSGFVASSDALYQAKQLASQTPGVKSVDSQIRVEPHGENANQPD